MTSCDVMSLPRTFAASVRLRITATMAAAAGKAVQRHCKASWKLPPVFKQHSTTERERSSGTMTTLLVCVDVEELTRTTREVCTHIDTQPLTDTQTQTTHIDTQPLTDTQTQTTHIDTQPLTDTQTTHIDTQLLTDTQTQTTHIDTQPLTDTQTQTTLLRYSSVVVNRQAIVGG